jgi:hypothetical protein
MGRRRAEVFLDLLRGEGFAQPNPRPMFSNPPGLCASNPDSEGLRERIWWGAGSNATAGWAAKLGVNLQSSTLKEEEDDGADSVACGQPLADCGSNPAAPHPAYPIKCRTSAQRTQAPESVDTRKSLPPFAH